MKLRELLELGIEGTCMDVLAFNFVNLGQLEGALKMPSLYSGLILTSPRAIEAISKCASDELKENLNNGWADHTHFAVGEATTQLAASTLGLVCHGKDTGCAKILAEVIAKDGATFLKPFLFPCGTLRREELPNILAEGGVELKCLQVYETVGHPLLRDNLISWIAEKGLPRYMIFFSPSGIKYTLPILRSMAAPFESIRFAAIGPTTAEALRLAGLTVFCVAANPTAKALALAIATACSLEPVQVGGAEQGTAITYGS